MYTQNMEQQLFADIARVRDNFKSDGYQMSIGEMASLYRSKEFTFTPNYSWSAHQKERFIESILYGLPLPSIVIEVREDGGWNLLDGAKRFNAIFDFMGLYEELHGEVPMPLHIQGQVLLYKDLPESMRIDFIRARMDVKIVMFKDGEAERVVRSLLNDLRQH